MAFTYTKTDESNAIGRKKQVLGTFTNTSGSTGGAISTGLSVVLHASFTAQGTTVTANSAVYTASGGTVTLKCDADADGTFCIYGY